LCRVSEVLLSELVGIAVGRAHGRPLVICWYTATVATEYRRYSSE
jgi:hypothetical protein